MIKSLFYTFFCIIFIAPVNFFGQRTATNNLQERIHTKQDIVLLKNDRNLIPIQYLDQTKISLISNLSSKNYIEELLGKYAKITRFNFRSIISSTTEQKQLNGYSAHIIALHNSTDLLNLKKLQLSQSKIIIAFSIKVLIEFLNSNIDYQALIFSPNSNQLHQEVSAQLIFGGIAASGKLKNSYSSIYQKGAGLKSQKIRLGYSIPEEEGLSAEFIDKKVDSIMKFAIQNHAFPGAQLLVAKNNTVIFHKTYGFHTYDSVQKVQQNDIYDLASVTKITGPLPALMMLYDEQKIDLDQPFSAYWRSWKHREDKKTLTFREMLAHQAGLTPYIVFLNAVMKKGQFKTRFINNTATTKFSLQAYDKLFVNRRFENKMYRIIKGSNVSDKRKYKYSGLSFLIYPKLISQLTGTTYQKYLQKEFYKPLGAYTLGFNPMLKHFNNRIVPTEMDTFFRKTLTKGWVHDENAALLGGVSGNAGLFATATDAAKIMQLYVQKGIYGGHRYFSETTVNEFINVQYPENNNRRGLGFDKPLLNNSKLKLKDAYPAPEVSSESFGHSGYTGTFLWADPKNQLVFIFLSNRVHPTRKNRNLYNLNIRPALQQVFYQAAKN